MINARGFDRSYRDRENWNSSHILINILNCKTEHRKKNGTRTKESYESYGKIKR